MSKPFEMIDKYPETATLNIFEREDWCLDKIADLQSQLSAATTKIEKLEAFRKLHPVAWCGKHGDFASSSEDETCPKCQLREWAQEAHDDIMKIFPQSTYLDDSATCKWRKRAKGE